MIDLLVNPGTRMAPDKRQAAPPTVIPSPLQYDRLNPFGGNSLKVSHWSRAEARGEAGGEPRTRDEAENALESPARSNFPDAMRNFGLPNRISGGERSPPVPQGLDFLQAEGSQGANNKARGYTEDKEKYGLVNLLDRRPLSGGHADPKLRSPDVGDGSFFLENVSRGADGNNNNNNNNNQRMGSDSRKSAESPRDEAVREYDKAWAREGRRATGSDDSGRGGGLGNAGRMLEQIASETSDFEISWEDIEMGERIGQGDLLFLSQF